MKKRSRELNIFSMSALDLFASAMGAFILITFVLFPYFPNTGDSAEIAKLERENARLEEEKAKLEQEKDRLKQKSDNTSKLGQEKAKLEQEKDRLQQENAKLKQDIDNTSILLGIRTTAKKFVIVVDMSGSIHIRNKQDYRQFIILSIQEILAAFKSQIELVMVGFQGDNQLHYWPTNRTYFQVNQNTRNRVMSQIQNWMKQVGGGTPTFEALREALALSPEEIILLTDGEPSTGQYEKDWRRIVNTITSLNRQKIPIHAVAVGEYVKKRDFIDFLLQLTKRNNGSLVGAKPG